MKRGLIYPVTSTAKTAAHDSNDTPFHDQKVGVGCHIAKSDNRPHFLGWHYQLETLL
jgi:hypothetical protein